MKLIINISEDVYTRLFDNGIQDNEIAVDDVCEMARSLRLGTPLLEGYGRLIDADELIKQFEAVANDEWNKQVGASKGLEDAIDIVDDAPTIIEADRNEVSE